MKRFKYILLLILVLATALLTSCREEWGKNDPTAEETYEGELIQFASGTTMSEISRAASTYYMPDSFRFVCRMYYMAYTGTEIFDVTGGTDITAWLQVDGDKGNSLYRTKVYSPYNKNNYPIEADIFGNDQSATCFYWQNRRKHAFLAWTDINHAKAMTGDPQYDGTQLKFTPADVDYVWHSGTEEEQWVQERYEVYSDNSDSPLEFSNWPDLTAYMESGDNYEQHIQGRVPAEVNVSGFTQYYYEYGWSCKYSEQQMRVDTIDSEHRKVGWIQYQMFYDKLEYTGATGGSHLQILEFEIGEKFERYLYNTQTGEYLAEVVITDQTDTLYYTTDKYGNVRFDETRPRYTFYFKRLEAKQKKERVELYAANAFDLTRKPKGDGTYAVNSVNDQPDICQALTIQAPLGATQSANRVNLYFKHQFSQIQVNLKSSSDESVSITANHIQKVELLGVSECGYVFTELNKEGQVQASTYQAVDISKYSDEHLRDNPFGTSFEMFTMDSATIGYLKSFNAIAFGQLQAIRVTWNESEDGSGISHVSTYHVASDDLRNLKSSTRYIWNIELRRGTLAIVRTDIINWIVEDAVGNRYEYGTEGTIND